MVESATHRGAGRVRQDDSGAWTVEEYSLTLRISGPALLGPTACDCYVASGHCPSITAWCWKRTLRVLGRPVEITINIRLFWIKLIRLLLFEFSST